MKQKKNRQEKKARIVTYFFLLTMMVSVFLFPSSSFGATAAQKKETETTTEVEEKGPLFTYNSVTEHTSNQKDPGVKDAIEEAILAGENEGKDSDETSENGTAEGTMMDTVMKVLTHLEWYLLADSFRKCYDILFNIVGGGVDDIIFNHQSPVYSFALIKGNVYGYAASILYTIFRDIVFILLAIKFVCSLIRLMIRNGYRSSSVRQETVETVGVCILSFISLALLPEYLNLVLVIRDIFLDFFHNAIFGTNGNLIYAYLALIPDSPLLGTAMFLAVFGITIAFVFEYVMLALTIALGMISFPISILMAGTEDFYRRMSEWFSRMLAAVLTPFIDGILLLFPLFFARISANISVADKSNDLIIQKLYPNNAVVQIFGAIPDALKNYSSLGIMFPAVTFGLISVLAAFGTFSLRKLVWEFAGLREPSGKSLGSVTGMQALGQFKQMVGDAKRLAGKAGDVISGVRSDLGNADMEGALSLLSGHGKANSHGMSTSAESLKTNHPGAGSVGKKDAEKKRLGSDADSLKTNAKNKSGQKNGLLGTEAGTKEKTKPDSLPETAKNGESEKNKLADSAEEMKTDAENRQTQRMAEEQEKRLEEEKETRARAEAENEETLKHLTDKMDENANVMTETADENGNPDAEDTEGQTDGAPFVSYESEPYQMDEDMSPEELAEEEIKAQNAENLANMRAEDASVKEQEARNLAEEVQGEIDGLGAERTALDQQDKALDLANTQLKDSIESAKLKNGKMSNDRSLEQAKQAEKVKAESASTKIKDAQEENRKLQGTREKFMKEHGIDSEEGLKQKAQELLADTEEKKKVCQGRIDRYEASGKYSKAAAAKRDMKELDSRTRYLTGVRDSADKIKTNEKVIADNTMLRDQANDNLRTLSAETIDVTQMEQMIRGNEIARKGIRSQMGAIDTRISSLKNEKGGLLRTAGGYRTIAGQQRVSAGRARAFQQQVSAERSIKTTYEGYRFEKDPRVALRQAEARNIMSQCVNLSNFDQPQFAGILSHQQKEQMYRQRAQRRIRAGVLSAVASTAGAAVGGYTAGSLTMFYGQPLSGASAMMGATMGSGLGQVVYRSSLLQESKRPEFTSLTVTEENSRYYVPPMEMTASRIRMASQMNEDFIRRYGFEAPNRTPRPAEFAGIDRVVKQFRQEEAQPVYTEADTKLVMEKMQNTLNRYPETTKGGYAVEAARKALEAYQTAAQYNDGYEKQIFLKQAEFYAGQVELYTEMQNPGVSETVENVPSYTQVHEFPSETSKYDYIIKNMFGSNIPMYKDQPVEDRFETTFRFKGQTLSEPPIYYLRFLDGKKIQVGADVFENPKDFMDSSYGEKMIQDAVPSLRAILSDAERNGSTDDQLKEQIRHTFLEFCQNVEWVETEVD